MHSDDWKNYIPIYGKGFTQEGIRRINESIRTYVYCILGAQAMVRHDIVGDTGLAFDTQKQFQTLVEDAIQGQTLVDSIKTFQSASLLIRSKKSYTSLLEKVGSRLDFAIGPDLQLIPSDMRLHVGITDGYNNALLTADSSMKFGINDNINVRKKRSIPKSTTPHEIKKIIPKSTTPHEINKEKLKK